MHCHHVRARLSEFLDHELPVHVAQDVHAHMSGCPGCRREFEDLAVVKRSLRSMRAVEPPAELSARLRASLERTASPDPRVRVSLSPAALAFSIALVAAFVALQFGRIRPINASHTPPPQIDVLHDQALSASGDPFSGKVPLISTNYDSRR